MYGGMAGAEARGRMPPCVVFNRRDAKVSLISPGKKEEKGKKE